MSQYLRQLRLDAQFRKELEEVRKKRPTLPAYDPQRDNVRELSHFASMQQGFDLCLSILESK